jgi:hypothetical protein
MSNVESLFHQEMLNLYRCVRQEVHYDARRFLAKLTEAGGLEAARHLLRSDRFSDGFVAITLAGRPDLTLEALVLREPWRALFTGEELAIARRRLAECGIRADDEDERRNPQPPFDLATGHP